MNRSLNAFAILDDSDDEAPPSPVKEVKKVQSQSSTKNNDISTGKNRDRRRPNNNDRNTKGGRGRRPARDGKRTHDRRSGTGRGKEIKKGGGGSRNWGSDKNDAKKAEGKSASASASATKVNETDNTNTNNENEPPSDEQQPDVQVVQEEKVEEPEEVLLSLQEYLESKKPMDDEIFAAKKEKTVSNEFEGKEAHVSVEENFLVMGSGKSLRKKTGKKEVQKLHVDFRFGGGGDGRGGRGNRDSRRDNGRDRRGGGRGDRRSRGGGDRGGRRGGRGGGNKNAFALDSNAFPSL